MELNAYFKALRRRWPIIIALPMLAVMLGLYQEVTRTPVWSTDVRARMLFDSERPPSEDFDFNQFYRFGSSEYNIDDLVIVVRGNVFAEAVAGRLGDPTITTSEIQDAIDTAREHRVLTISVNALNHDEALTIATAVAAELEENASTHLGLNQIDSEALIEMVERPEEAEPDTGRARLLVILQMLAAVGAGVLLAFLIDYFDDTLYDGESVSSTLRLPHLASVPWESRG